MTVGETGVGTLVEVAFITGGNVKRSSGVCPSPQPATTRLVVNKLSKTNPIALHQRFAFIGPHMVGNQQDKTPGLSVPSVKCHFEHRMSARTR
jgi:hypothetical protein